MRRMSQPAVVYSGVLLACAGICSAQFGRGDASWATTGADAQRSSWVRQDPKISKEELQKPDFRFLWKLKVADKPGQANTLTPAVLLSKYIGYRGFRDLALIQSNGDSVYGIDVDLGRVEWKAKLKPASDSSAVSSHCATGIIAGLARPTVTAFPGTGMAFGRGRGGPAHSGVGEAGEGAVTLAQAGMLNFRPPPTPPPTAPGTPAAAVPGGSNAPGVPGSGEALPIPRRQPIVIHTLSEDGAVHTMFVSNGIEPEAPVAFVPAGSTARGFIVINTTAYVAAGGCSGGGNEVLALDLASKQVAKWDAGSEIAGSEGPAFGPDGTLYATTSGGDFVALDSKTLEVKDTYSTKEAFISSPVVFQYRQKVLAVAATKEGSLHLVDTKSLGGGDHRTALYKTEPLPEDGRFAPGALASWQDSGGRRWILAAVDKGSKGAITAWQVQDQNDTLTLVPGWTSSEINSPSAPMIINGVVFAASNAAPELDSKSKAHSSPAVMYALDSTTGKTLWSSGKAITAAAHRGRLSAGNSQVYLGTDDGTFYAFGSWIERQ